MYNKPWCEFPCSPDDLFRAVCFGDVTQMAEELGVETQELVYWRTGRKPVPKLVYLYLTRCKSTTLGQQYGPFRGFTLSDRGDALICPATNTRVNYSEIILLPDYRRASQLATQQAELIEQLMIERDFYRQNCHRQAKFGLLVNQLFPDDEP